MPLRRTCPGWYALTGEERQAALAQRLAVRQQQSAPVVERIRQWALAQRAAPGSAFRKALEYLLKLWDGLSVFLSNPFVPIDNNHVERQLRDRVMDRKNHYVPNVPVFTLAPDRGCVVLFPAHATLGRGGRKRETYAREGVTYGWLADPSSRTLETFQLRDGQWVEREPGQVGRASGPSPPWRESSSWRGRFLRERRVMTASACASCLVFLLGDVSGGVLASSGVRPLG